MPIPANVIVMMPSGSVPSGWSAVSDMNGKFPKGTTSGSTSTGGSATHTHSGGSHTHSETSHGHGSVTTGTATSYGGGGDTGGGGVTLASHTHNGTPSNASGTSGSASNSWDTDNHEPSYYNFLYIKSDGTPEGLPNGCVALYNSNSAPTGWTAHTASQGKFARGNSSGGGTGGAGTAHTHAGTEGSHTHSAGNHTHGSSGATSSANNGGGEKSGSGQWAHNHSSLTLSSGGAHTSGSSSAGTSGSNTPEPSYRKVAGITNNSGGDKDTIGVICMWQGSVGSIPDAYNLCDGSNSTPNMSGRFLRMASGDNGGTGGSTTHSHSWSTSHTHSTSSHNHTSSVPTSTASCNEVGPSSGITGCGHGHNATTSASTTLTFGNATTTAPGSVNHEPSYKYIGYIQQAELVSASFVATVTVF